MFIFLQIFVLFFALNNCLSASNLIQTKVYSPSVRQPQNVQTVHVRHLGTGSEHYYPVFPHPFGSNPSPGELQYSASVPQPNVDSSRGASNLNTRPNFQYQRQRKEQGRPNQRPNARFNSLDVSPIKYVMNNPLTTPQVQSQSSPKKASPPPMYLKAQFSATTLKSVIPSNNYQMNTNVRSVTIKRRPKSELNPTASTRVQSIRFNWPKAVPQNKDNNYNNNTQNHQIFTNQTEIIPTKGRKQYKENIDVMRRPLFGGESQQNFRYDSRQNAKFPEMPSVETELFREPTTPSTIQTSIQTTTQTTTETPEPTTFLTTELYREESSNSEKSEKLSPIDSELNYRTQYFDMFPIDKYESTEQDKYEKYDVPQFGTPVTDSYNLVVPEKEVSYPQPELETEPEPASDPYEEGYSKDLYESLDGSNGQELKPLLEQFIQQLELLKFVASKELKKSLGTSSYDSEAEGKLIGQTVLEPLVSKRGATYDEYQNARSFEQNLSNTESKGYRDTNEKYWRKPCKKPYHPGALPNLAPYQ